MARPRRNDHTRDTIIETGLTMLAEQGYHGTGLKQLLDRTGVPKGSFYHYFASKEAFVAEVIRHYGQAVLDHANGFIVPGQPRASIQALCAAGIERYQQRGCRHGCLVGSLAAELGGSSPLCQQAMAEAIGRWDEWLEQQLIQARELGQLAVDQSPANLSRQFWDRWQGALLRMQLRGDTRQMEQDMDDLLNQWFGSAA